MNEKVETNDTYQILNGDDDVLLLGQATFTVRRLKELVRSQLNEILEINGESKSRRESIRRWMTNLRLNEETIISGGDINWNSPKQGIYCQLLKIGSQGWQKGKIKIEIYQDLNSWETQTSIKFCADEPLEQKSPLDDIRQSEEYKKLSNN
ncbi:KGK domain-containing protein [Microcoleus sp. herbarium19]|uniref:KGK domain-containing protein n=1 Tax=unclassified Microcoleus TaxID=2642155 RepID=UPI002FD3A8B1